MAEKETISWFAGVDWDPNGTKFAFSMLEAPQLESANSRTVVRVWQSWETGFSRWQARQVRSPWQSKYRTDL
jgi:hypothetical protein